MKLAFNWYLSLFILGTSVYMLPVMGLHDHCLEPNYRVPTLPYISGDAFRARADFIFDETNSYLNADAVPDRSIIFVGAYALKDFFQYHHERIPGQYILITHNTDYEAPGPYAKYLEDEKIIAWFAQNVEKIRHPKLVPIPIGLGNRYVYDVSIIDKLRKQSSIPDRDILLYLSFMGVDILDRIECFSVFKNQSFCRRYPNLLRYEDYLKNLQRAKFVLSPRGWGLDCHRTWEALYAGAVPVVKTSASDDMFTGLPVLIIDDWEEVTEVFLLEAFENMKSQNYNLDKLFMDYWIELINYTKSSGEPPKKSV